MREVALCHGFSRDEGSNVLLLCQDQVAISERLDARYYSALSRANSSV